MKAKIKYIFIDGEVREVEADEEFAVLILLEDTYEESRQRKQERIIKRLRQLAADEKLFTSQWGNPEEDLLLQEEDILLKEVLDDLTFAQYRRLRRRLEGMSYTEIARLENVSVQTVKDSIKYASKKLLTYMQYMSEE